ncbi:MAG: O-antigen ligase domain-containing protein [Chitinophagaceae bacterium]|nr:MAG: O-antigen ligase domain-containing protein [Chitinophagaceae bacterium]
MQPIWFLVPFVIIGIVYLIQKPITLFYLLLFSIPWSIEYHFPSGLGTDLPDEPLMWLTCIAATVLFIQHRKSVFKKLHPLLLLLLLQILWMVVSVIYSTHFILSVKYFLAKIWYLTAFLIMPLLLWRDQQIFKRSAIVLLASMLLATTVGIVRHGLTGFSFSTINTAISPFFRNHVNYSALLVCMIPLQVVCWKQAKSAKLRRIILLSFFVTVPAMYFSFARGAWLALPLGGLAYLLLKKQWLLRGFLLTILSGLIVLLWLKEDNRYLQFAHNYQKTVFHQNFNEHLTATYQLKDLSTAERFHRWIAGVRMIEDSWQTGFGPTTFYQHYKSYTVPAFKTWVSKNEEQSTVHNYFLLLLVEQGAMGLLLFLLLLGLSFWYTQKIYSQTKDVFWRRTVAAIAVILAMLCTVNFLSDLIETDKVGSVFYLCIATLIVADRRQNNCPN